MRGTLASMFTPQQAADFEKHTLDFIAGSQELAKFHKTDSPEYQEAWAKTQAAKEAIDALIALTSTNQ
jgi:hypothetical protein